MKAGIVDLRRVTSEEGNGQVSEFSISSSTLIQSKSRDLPDCWSVTSFFHSLTSSNDKSPSRPTCVQFFKAIVGCCGAHSFGLFSWVKSLSKFPGINQSPPQATFYSAERQPGFLDYFLVCHSLYEMKGKEFPRFFRVVVRELFHRSSRSRPVPAIGIAEEASGTLSKSVSMGSLLCYALPVN